MEEDVLGVGQRRGTRPLRSSAAFLPSLWMDGRSSAFPQIRVCSSASKKGSRTPVPADVMGQCHFPWKSRRGGQNAGSTSPTALSDSRRAPTSALPPLRLLIVWHRSILTHSRIVATFARTSSMIAAGTFSSFLPWRAPRSSARGWSQRTTPVVLVPAPVRDTANPAVRAKFPPLAMGR